MNTRQKRRYIIFARGNPGTDAPVIGWVDAENKTSAAQTARMQHGVSLFVQRWGDASASEKYEAERQQVQVDARLAQEV